jgi:hypothetical protein
LRLPGFFISLLCLLDQVRRLAAASTIPVTKAAIQENSKMSFRTLAIMAPPMQKTPRRPWHHGQKVAKLAQNASVTKP